MKSTKIERQRKVAQNEREKYRKIALELADDNDRMKECLISALYERIQLLRFISFRFQSHLVEDNNLHYVCLHILPKKPLMWGIEADERRFFRHLTLKPKDAETTDINKTYQELVQEDLEETGRCQKELEK